MAVIAPGAPRVIPGRTIDILAEPTGSDISRGYARVDLDDPVFFDHPLDHVPGMLLAVAMLALAEQVSLLEADNIVFRSTFTRFCELAAPVEVTAVREIHGTHRIETNQCGRSVAKAQLALVHTAPPNEGIAVPALGNCPIEGDLVHRADIRNVALNSFTVENGRVWAGVREESAIAGLPPRTRVIACALEAARQFAIAVLHRWGEHPPTTKMIFVGFTAELPTAAAAEARALSWQITSPEQTRKLHIHVHATGGLAHKVGSILIASRCVDGEEYAQLRAG